MNRASPRRGRPIGVGAIAATSLTMAPVGPAVAGGGSTASAVADGERVAVGRPWMELGAPHQHVASGLVWVVGLVALISAIAIVVVLVWNRTLRRMVDRNTEDLRRGLREREVTEAQRSRLELAISHAAELVVVADADWSVRYLNPTYERVSGRSTADRVGRPLHELFIATADRDTLDDAHAGLERSSVWRGRLALLGRDSTTIPVEGAIASFTLPSGEPGGFVGTMRDARREVELQAELRQSERLRSVGTLAAGIAHDFNNLLTPILGATELIELTDDEERRARYLRLIRDAAIRAAELVQQVRMYSLDQDIEPERFDLRVVVLEAVELIRHTCSADIAVDCHVPEAPCVIDAVPSQLHQLVMNLLANAVQAMKSGGRLRVGLHELERSGGRLRVGLNELERTGATTGERHVELVVADTGVGIDGEARRRLFEPYFSTRADAGGTGLGLFAVAGIVQTLDGRIDVEGERGVGTTVRVTLPVDGGPIGRARADVIGPGSGDRRPAQILVVDDNAVVLDVLESILGERGDVVTSAASAHDALASFDAGRRFDLLLTDLDMPETRGDELARRIRQRCPDIPIVMLTGHYDTEALEADWSVLLKPIGLAALAEAIESAIGTRATARPHADGGPYEPGATAMRGAR